MSQKRFYTTVSVIADGPYFQVTLDDRPIKTPGGKAHALPKRALAEAIADEWRAQGDKLDLATMQLTKAVNTVIDRIAPRRAEVIDDVARFAASDLLCYRAETPGSLVARQIASWDPWLAWAQTHAGASFRCSTGITHVEQPPETLDAIRRAMETVDNFALPALHTGVTITGSAVLGLAFALRRIGPDDTLAISHVDEDFQAERWGRDAEAEAVRKNRLVELQQARRLLDLLAD
jgi:chaperone required for assembly of F1-ATPase